MSREIAGLTEQLEKLAQEPAPPSSIDITKARMVGRRRLLRRRVAWVGVTGFAIAVSLSLSSLPGLATKVFSPSARRATNAPTSAAAEHNPLIAPATFGWLPASIAGVGYSAGYEQGSQGTTAVALGRGKAAPRILLSLYPVGVTPPLGSFAGVRNVKVPAPPVHGRSAYWLTSDTAEPTNQRAGAGILRWQTKDGRWAQIDAYYLNTPDLPGTLLHVADGVIVNDVAVPLPLHITGLPADFQITQIDLSRPAIDGHGAWRLQMFYGAKSGTKSGTKNGTKNGTNISIIVRPTAGAPAPDKGLTCTKANGLDLCLAVDGDPSPSLTAIGGLQGLLHRITLLGTDEHNWTTHVTG
ncbi:hypothetical protein ACWEO4_36270 [Streptomyces sp. NPDC004393]